MAPTPAWPQADATITDSGKEILEAELAYLNQVAKTELEEDVERLKSDNARLAADDEAMNASIAAFHTNLMEVSKDSIDRARTGAETVQKAAGAIGAAYTGVLALAFSVSERPLPSRGLIPTVLLGWAVVCSTAYLAYLSRTSSTDAPEPHSNLATAAMRRTNAFTLWVRASVMDRKLVLRISVIALAFGLAALPVPFVNLGGVQNDAPALSSSPGWPKPPAAETEASKVLYEAEVKEAAEVRAESKPIADDGNDVTWWVLCGVALLLSIAIPGGFEILDSALNKRAAARAS